MKILLLFFTIITIFPSLLIAQCDDGGKQNGGHGSGGDPKNKRTYNNFTDAIIFVVRGSDPNDITGPRGYEEKQWMSVNDKLPYTIRFENDPKVATSPAHNVFVRLPVGPRYNINSFRLGKFGFGRYTFASPENSTFYTTRLDMRDSLGIYVDFIAGIDIVRNELFWTFRSIEPETGVTPTDPFKGFLKINDSTAKKDSLPGAGEGFVSFHLSPVKELVTGDTAAAQASIIFDTNEEVLTNVWMNTIDAVAPISKVNSYTTKKDTITLNWSGQDDNGGTGVRDYALYASDNGGPFDVYEKRIRDSSVFFVGTPGRTYSFFTLATDNTGNTEALKKGAELSVQLPATSAPGLITFSGKVLLQGAYNASTGVMNNALNTLGVLQTYALNQPYNASALNRYAGSEKVGADFFTANPEIVDWVLLELRDAASPSIILGRRAAFVKQDGTLVDTNGVNTQISFFGFSPGSYHIAIRHRNHLGIRTLAALDFSTGTANHDFTTGSNKSFQNQTYPSTVQMGNVWVMRGGDANGNGNVKYNGPGNDQNQILNIKLSGSLAAVLSNVYSPEDVNLNGNTKWNGPGNDQNFLLNVILGGSLSIVILEQL